MSQKWNELLEQIIIGKVISALLDDGYRLELSDQDGGGLFVYAAADGGEKPEGGYEHWVRLTIGNGADVINDWTVSLSTIIEPISKFAAEYMD